MITLDEITLSLAEFKYPYQEEYISSLLYKHEGMRVRVEYTLTVKKDDPERHYRVSLMTPPYFDPDNLWAQKIFHARTLLAQEVIKALWANHWRTGLSGWYFDVDAKLRADVSVSHGRLRTWEKTND